MQEVCAKSFQNESVIALMTPANHVKLMDETLNIIINADVA